MIAANISLQFSFIMVFYQLVDIRCFYNSFPFLNINAIFVVFAMGADDIFVAVDMWKYTRQDLPSLDFSTDKVAVYALPKIAFATFVTSITTAASFFASAGVKTPIVASFVIFCGILVMMDYILSIVILFPAICMYDRWLEQGRRSRWISFFSVTVAKKKSSDADIEDGVCGECDDGDEVETNEGECKSVRKYQSQCFRIQLNNMVLFSLFLLSMHCF
jgi:predicted RND superfamily exporter protein